MNILVTGATGMLGRAVRANLADAPDCNTTGLCFSRGGDGLVRADLGDVAGIAPLLDRLAPDVVIHTAAVRRPDDFAANAAASRRLNVDATDAIARWVGARPGAFMVYMSSDYVFDGTAAPYRTDAPVRPANAYGASKADGETVVRAAAADRAAILRVPILYGDVETLAESSVTTVLAAVAALRDAARPAPPLVLDDWAVRYPTHVADVAEVIAAIVRRRLVGTFHWSAPEAMTKFDMGVTAARILGVDVARLVGSGAPANGTEPRPKDCHLDRSALEALGANASDRTYAATVTSLARKFDLIG